MRRIELLTNASLALVFLTSSGAFIARAQGTPPTPSQSQDQPKAGPEKNWNRDADLDDPKLNLRDDQKTQIKKVRDSMHSQVQDLRNDSSLSREEKMQKMRQLREDANKQIEALLTPDQRKVWQEKQKERQKEWGGHRGHHQGEGGPPQQ